MAIRTDIYPVSIPTRGRITLTGNATWNGGRNLYMDRTPMKIVGDDGWAELAILMTLGSNADTSIGNYNAAIEYNSDQTFPDVYESIPNEIEMSVPAKVMTTYTATLKRVGFTATEFAENFIYAIGGTDAVPPAVYIPALFSTGDNALYTQVMRITNRFNASLFVNNCFQGTVVCSGIIGTPDTIRNTLDNTMGWGTTYSTDAVNITYTMHVTSSTYQYAAQTYAMDESGYVTSLYGPYDSSYGNESGSKYIFLPVLLKKTTLSVTGNTPTISVNKVNDKYYLNIKTRYQAITQYSNRGVATSVNVPQSKVRYSIDGATYSAYANYTGSETIDGVPYSTYSVEIPASKYYGSHTYSAQNQQHYYTGDANTRCYEFLYSKDSNGNETNVYTIRKIRWNISSKSASASLTHNIDVPTNLTVKQNGFERTSSSYIDSMYISWTHVSTRDSYGYRIKYGDLIVTSGTTTNNNITISNLSAGINYTIYVWTNISTESSSQASTTKTLSRLPNPTNVLFNRSGVNYGTLSWNTSYGDTSLTYFESYDGNTYNGTTNNTSSIFQNLTQGQHTFKVAMKYSNGDNANSNTFNSDEVSVTYNMTKLPTPVLSSTEDYSNVVFRNSEDEDCYLLTDGSFVKVSDYVSGEIKQGITGITFSYPIAPDYDITGIAYAFYSKLGSNAYVFDTDVASGTRSVGLGDTTYGSVGHHKVKVQAVYSADTDYNSDDSNEVEYPVNTLDAPTLVWGEVNHPSSRIIPEGYEPVEYIESDGRQYIDTGYAPAPLANIDIEFMYLGTEYSGWTCLYGVRGSLTTSYFCAFINSANDILSPNYSTYDPGNNSDTEIVPNGYMHIKTQRGNLYLNSQLQVNASTSLTNRTTPDANLYLFAYGTPNGVDNRQIKARVYDCNIYDGDTIVRRFIPVRRTSDDKPGLYELLSDTFYPSNSGVDFIAGPDIILWDMNKVYESRIEWLPVSTVSASGNYADYYFVEVIGNDTVVGNAVTVLQPSDLTQRVGTWIPDPDPLNGAVKGLIAQLPSQTTDYVVNVRALSFNSWYVGGSAPGTAQYQIIRLGIPQLPEWDPETFTLSWSPVADANTYYLYDSGVLIETVTDGTSYHFLNLEDGLHQFRVTAMKRTFAVN